MPLIFRSGLMLFWVPLLLSAPERQAYIHKSTVPVPSAMDQKLIAQWQNVGAETGWMSVGSWGHFSFAYSRESEAIPAFRFTKWQTDMMAKVPQPNIAFGLRLHDISLQDSDLKTLGRLEHLALLDLSFSLVS